MTTLEKLYRRYRANARAALIIDRAITAAYKAGNIKRHQYYRTTKATENAIASANQRTLAIMSDVVNEQDARKAETFRKANAEIEKAAKEIHDRETAARLYKITCAVDGIQQYCESAINLLKNNPDLDPTNALVTLVLINARLIDTLKI